MWWHNRGSIPTSCPVGHLVWASCAHHSGSRTHFCCQLARSPHCAASIGLWAKLSVSVWENNLLMLNLGITVYFHFFYFLLCSLFVFTSCFSKFLVPFPFFFVFSHKFHVFFFSFFHLSVLIFSLIVMSSFLFLFFCFLLGLHGLGLKGRALSRSMTHISHVTSHVTKSGLHNGFKTCLLIIVVIT